MPTFTFEAVAEVERQVRFAVQAEPREIGGLLVGDEDVIRAALPIANSAPDPLTAYVPAPEQLSSRLRQIEGAGKKVLGSYHTHPGGRAILSRADAVLAGTLGLLLVVAAPDADEPAHWGWGLYDGDCKIDLVIAPPLACI